MSIFGKKSSASAVVELQPVPADLALLISRQCPAFNAAALTECSFTQKKGTYKDCKREVEVLDTSGKLVVRGREFHSGEWLFWLP